MYFKNFIYTIFVFCFGLSAMLEEVSVPISTNPQAIVNSIAAGNEFNIHGIAFKLITKNFVGESDNNPQKFFKKKTYLVVSPSNQQSENKKQHELLLRKLRTNKIPQELFLTGIPVGHQDIVNRVIEQLIIYKQNQKRPCNIV